jgi:hypothetical protein
METAPIAFKMVRGRALGPGTGVCDYAGAAFDAQKQRIDQ